MIVYIPSPLRSYTSNQSQVEAAASSLAELSTVLDQQFPGIKFRMIDEQQKIRQHIKFFVNKEEVHTLDRALQPNDVVHIMCALSGG